MPCHSELKKDVPNCEKLRRAVRMRRHADIRMGEPGWCNDQSSIYEYIVYERGTQGTETSKYLEEEKTKVIA